MTGKEFYVEFFGVKNPQEKGTTINESVWRFAEAYVELINQGQSLPLDSVSQQREFLIAYCEHIFHECREDDQRIINEFLNRYKK